MEKLQCPCCRQWFPGNKVRRHVNDCIESVENRNVVLDTTSEARAKKAERIFRNGLESLLSLQQLEEQLDLYIDTLIYWCKSRQKPYLPVALEQDLVHIILDETHSLEVSTSIYNALRLILDLKVEHAVSVSTWLTFPSWLGAAFLKFVDVLHRMQSNEAELIARQLLFVRIVLSYLREDWNHRKLEGLDLQDSWIRTCKDLISINEQKKIGNVCLVLQTETAGKLDSMTAIELLQAAQLFEEMFRIC